MTQRKFNNFSASGDLKEMQQNGECATGYTACGQRVVSPFLQQSAQSPQVVGAKIDPPTHDSMPDG